MTRIAHVALWTTDIERLTAFYSGYFGAQAGADYANPARGFESRFLTFADGVCLELMRSRQVEPRAHAPGAERMGLTHLALALGSERQVDECTQALRTAGFAVLDGPRRTGDGYYESVVLDPDGNRLELTV
jgi:lactoylglutathione lyase